MNKGSSVPAAAAAAPAAQAALGQGPQMLALLSTLFGGNMTPQMIALGVILYLWMRSRSSSPGAGNGGASVLSLLGQLL